MKYRFSRFSLKTDQANREENPRFQGIAMKATDRLKLIDRIKTLDGLTDEERSSLLGLLRESKTYGLVWEDKPEDVEERLREELPVLIEDKDKALASGGEDAPNHILIEGDNLESLTSLAYTHAGKIDVIYIDPPYNTGNKDFIYNDSYIDSEDSYRHSKWLSFMSRRLKIAKKLLSDRGVIFISIDDNELHSLKILLDDREHGLFGENNFICQFIWQQGKKSSGNLVGINQEYILCYARNRALIDNPEMAWKIKKQGLDKIYAKYRELRKKFGYDNMKIQAEIRKFFSSLPENDPAYGSKHYNYVDDNGLFFADNSCAPDRPETRCHKPLIHPITKMPTAVPRLGWRWKESTLDRLVAEGKIYFGESEKTVPKIKKYLKDMEFEMPSTVFYKDGRGASAELDTILGEKLFNNPKDRFVISSLLGFRDNSLILDFFAGSGTTLHATMQLNAEDGGKRQCILCTNNENGICENVTYERNKRVIEGYTKPNGEFVEGLKNNHLRYYRTAFVSRERSIKNMRRLVHLATDMLCIKENLYDEKKCFAKMPTYKNIYRYFESDDKCMLVIYDERYIEEIVKMVQSVDCPSKIKVYVFSPSEDPWEATFEPVEDKIELCALPYAIYNAYKRVLPKQKSKFIDQPEEETESQIDEDEMGGLFEQEGGEK